LGTIAIGILIATGLEQSVEAQHHRHELTELRESPRQDAEKAVIRWRFQMAPSAFDVPDDVIYLNCASLAPRLKSVTVAARAALDRMAVPWGIQAADWFRDERSLSESFARLIGAPPHCTTLVPAVSYGIALAARNIPVKPGQNIVLIEHEYPSNYYSWRRLADAQSATIRSVDAPHRESLTDAIVSAIDRQTAIVAVANCQWTDGRLADLVRIGSAARRHGAAFVVDASQSLGAYPLDVRDCQPDFLTTVGYKWLLGPYGVGYLYVAERWHAKGEPLEESWLHREGSENFAALVDYTPNYRPGAQRFGQGESAQFYLLPMAIAALSQIAEWTPDRINAQLRVLTESLVERAEALGLSATERSQRAGHMVGLRSERGLKPGLAAALANRGIYVGIRGDCIRVAPHLHTTGDDIDRFVDALKTLTA
jgi:selenocysteine lyase/cysteine desulfurase